MTSGPSPVLQGVSISLLSLAAACAAAPDGPTSRDSPAGDGVPSGGGSSLESGGSSGGGFASGGSSIGGSGTGGVAAPGARNVCKGGGWTSPKGSLSATQIEAANAENNTNYHLLEGPVWRDGALYYSHFTNEASTWPSKIKRYTLDGNVEVVIDSSGSNGLAIDTTGNLLAATHDKKEISRYDVESGARTSVVSEYLANPFNAPNDLVVAANGDVFFTDPDSDQKSSAPGGQDKARVYRWDGTKLTVVDDSFKPNGIAISPDGAFLFVAGGGYSGKLRKYPLVAGNASAGEDVMELSEPDGIAFDCLGNLYATEHVAVSNRSRVRVFDQTYAEIATIAVGPAKGIGYSDVEAKATNLVFGGADGKTLFITATFSLWQIHLDVAGLPD